jgi:amino acid transporter
LLFGRRLASTEQAEHKMGVLAGVPALGLDGLSSSAYGPEAALTVLLPLGAAGLAYIGPIIGVILALLTILYFSYRQTISAYPCGGGSYTVARENLGSRAALLAGAALMIDYVLTVSVGISAGVGALISAAPGLQPYTVWLCLAALVLITIVNLRGTSEAGLAFALPTYLFVGSLGIVLVIGLVRAIASGGHPTPVVTPPALPAATGAVSLWLLLRSFASGCTAMTGVEAVSNGVSAFRAPCVRYAEHTLTAIVVILAILLGCIAYLCHAYQISAMEQTRGDYQTVLAQLAAAVVGRGAFYYLTMGSVLAVLALSANTSFVDFPRLCRLIAHDDYLPRAFTLMGRRLVYSIGIAFLTITSGALLVGFGGVTDRLIPLYAVGAFLAFTLSQLGMVVHWRKKLAEVAEPQGESRGKMIFSLAINGVGATATATALAVILAAKFSEGAWIVILAIPILLLFFRGMKHHYDRRAYLTRWCQPLALDNNHPPIVVLPLIRWNQMASRALRFGVRISAEIIAVHLSELEGDPTEDETAQLRRQWAHLVHAPAESAGLTPPPRLHVIHSRYRRFLEPLVRFVQRLEHEYPDRVVAVVIPELVLTSWWHWFLHNRRAARLKSALMHRCGSRVVVVAMPFHLHDTRLPTPVPAAELHPAVQPSATATPIRDSVPATAAVATKD